MTAGRNSVAGRIGSGLLVVLAGVLSACGGQSGGGTGGGAAAQPAPGARVYLQNCIGCHGPNGQGLGMQPPLSGSMTVNGDPAALTAWVGFGVRPATSPAGQYRALMPAFHYLKDEELAAVLTHLRSQWGNRSPPVTVETVRAVRAAQAGK
jgi:mono/diheme cytochrome c family protein